MQSLNCVQQFLLWDPPMLLHDISARAVLTCDGVLAAVALLGHISLEAVHAVHVVLLGGEANRCQRFTATVAHEALGVPRVVLVADPSGADGLKEGIMWSKQPRETLWTSVTQSARLPACSGSTSWQTYCRGRKYRRCHRPCSGSFLCGSAACIRSI